MKKIVLFATLALTPVASWAQQAQPEPTVTISMTTAQRIFNYLKADGGITSGALADTLLQEQLIKKLNASAESLQKNLEDSSKALKEAQEKLAKVSTPDAAPTAPEAAK
jgi:Skp family chaperone for outer membrane proteins